MEPIYREFGRRLRKARKKADLTQEALGNRVGLSRTSITNIEQGNQNVGLHLLYELAKAVGVPHTTLLPDRDATEDGDFSLDAVLQGRGRSDRRKVELEMRRLSEEDRELVIRLVRGEAIRNGEG